MGDDNPIRTLGDYFKPSHEGYRNTIELLVGNNVDLLRKVPHHGRDSWLQIQIVYDHVDGTTQKGIDYAVGGRLRKLRLDEAWDTIDRLAQ
nr:zinc finger, CCHC-type [Tanacetum cinerariifolium]